MHSYALYCRHLACAFAVVIALISSAFADPVNIRFDATLADPDPVSQDSWFATEVAVGADSDTDGFVDGSANVGPVSDGGTVAWQIFDRNTTATLNNPTYRRTLTAAELQEFYQRGWEFEFTVRGWRSSILTGTAGFAGWGVSATNDPGWGLVGSSARVGFRVVWVSGGQVRIEDAAGGVHPLGVGSDDQYHTIRCVGQPQSSLYEWFIDGVSYGTLDLAANTFAGFTVDTLTFTGETASGSGGMTNWKSVSLNSSANIVMDSTTGTITEDGVDVGGSFRGTDFAFDAGGGIGTFTFAGDFALSASDRLKVVGANAVSVVAARDVMIADGAIVDVSAEFANAGPGGGEVGSGGGGGSRGTKGQRASNSMRGSTGGGGRGGRAGRCAGIPLSPFGPENGGDGWDGDTGGEGDGSNGGIGGIGIAGGEGTAGYGGDQGGGVGGQVSNGGVGGLHGTPSSSYGSVGSGGNGVFLGSGGNGTDGTKAGDGGTGKIGKNGSIGTTGGGGQNLGSGIVISGGAGGAGGQGGGGGGGGGGGCSGNGGPGGGGEGGWCGGTGEPGSAGGLGGKGAAGGNGGVGAIGGVGGAGGGALEFVAYRRIEARGAFYAFGGEGTRGTLSSSANTGANGATDPNDGISGTAGSAGGGGGGKGGKGGNGGKGGTGGTGGKGGAGAGGTFKFHAPSVDLSGAELRVDGGTGAGAGRVIYSTVGNQPIAASINQGTTPEAFDGLATPNPHLSPKVETPYIAELIGGPEVGGLLTGVNAGSLTFSNQPVDAWVAAQRVESFGGVSYEGFDWVLLTNLTCGAVEMPLLGAGDTNYFHALVDGGVATNPAFGGDGAGTRDSLPAYAVYATLVPDSTTDFNLGFTPGATTVLRNGVALANGATAYLLFADPDCTEPIPAPTTEPVVYTLPATGDRLDYAATGSLTVEIEPAEALDAGASWSLVGEGGVYPDEVTADGLTPGAHVLTFTDIPGWISPRDQWVTVLPGGSTLTGTYQRAPEYQVTQDFAGSEVGGIGTQRVEHGAAIGFWIVDSNGAPDTAAVVLNPVGSMRLDNGWFSYEPTEEDRVPFEVQITSGGITQSFTIDPRPDLKPEYAVLQPDPGNIAAAGAGRDYSSIVETEDNRLVISGKTLIFDSNGGDTQLLEAINSVVAGEEYAAVAIYGERVEINSTLDLNGANLAIYARELELAAPLDGAADITLVCANISSPSVSAPLFTAVGGTITTPLPAADVEPLTEPGAAIATLTDDGVSALPMGLRWMHPLALRHVVNFIEDLYFVGHYDPAREACADYIALLSGVDALIASGVPMPILSDASDPAVDGDPTLSTFATLQLGQVRMELEALGGRLDDDLDYFGNQIGWVPLLSFESNFALTQSQVDRAIRTLYFTYWMRKRAEGLENAADALTAARTEVAQENEDLRDELDDLETRVGELQIEADSIDTEINDPNSGLRTLLVDAEERIEQRAQEIVEERNDIPEWKKITRVIGRTMTSVPLLQPRLGAVGVTLDTITRIDEGDTLNTVINAGYAYAELGDTIAGDLADMQAFVDAASGGELGEAAGIAMGRAGDLQETAGVLYQGYGDLQNALDPNYVPMDEVNAELQRLQASDPQLRDICVRLAALQERKLRLMNELAAAKSRVAEIPAILNGNLLALRTMKKQLDSATKVLDPQALGFVDGMEQRAMKRLRLYFYWLGKSYDYRFLEPYEIAGEAFDLTEILNKMRDIVDADLANGTPDAEIDATEFDQFKTVFDDQLDDIATAIVEDIQNGLEQNDQNGDCLTTTYALTPAQLAELNETGSTVINFYAENRLRTDREGFRFSELKLNGIEFEVTGGALGSNSNVALDLIHGTAGDSEDPAPVRLTSDGRAVLFNPRRADLAQLPRKWNSTYNFSNGNVTHTTISKGASSLLNLFVDSEGVQASEEEQLRVSRPAAWTDIRIVKQLGFIPNNVDVQLTGVTFCAEFDYFDKPIGRADVEVRVLDGDVIDPGPDPVSTFDDKLDERQAPALSPRVWVSRSDRHGRQDGQGSILRSFPRNAPVHFTAEPEYGRYAFNEWRRINANDRWEIAVDIGADNDPSNDVWKEALAPGDLTALTVTADTSKHTRIFPVYAYADDATPATVETIALDTSTSTETYTEYVVTFTEPVVGVDEEDFDQQVQSVTGAGRSRRVRVAAGETLSLADDDSIQDFGGNSLAGFGDNGDAAYDGSTTVESEPVTLALLGFDAGGAPIMEINGPAGGTAILQWSPDLVGWNEIATFTVGESYTDDDAIPEIRRFYRLVDAAE